MRQLTNLTTDLTLRIISKLPMRQLTYARRRQTGFLFSKLPMRQLTIVYMVVDCL